MKNIILGALGLSGLVAIWFGWVGFIITFTLFMYGLYREGSFSSESRAQLREESKGEPGSGFFSGLGKSVVGGVKAGNAINDALSGDKKMITKNCKCGWSDTKMQKEWPYGNNCPNCYSKGTLKVVR
mgnify:CR=1 FL=1|tara:strand:+ start:106 stop:486 length:381 start_codon:yes stop_codon:yes gene_type:complete